MLDRFQAAFRAFTAPNLVRSADYDAAGSFSRMPGWSRAAYGANAWHENPVALRGRAEGEYRNNPIARKAVDAIVATAVGASGIIPQFADRPTQKAWNLWSDTCDANDRLDWVALQNLILQTVIVQGEAFISLQLDPTKANPLVVTVLGPEHLDTSRTSATTHQGIAFDGLKRAGYWLYQRNPALSAIAKDSVFVPAANCLHVFRPITPGAQRGVSGLAPVLLAMREFDEQQQATLVATKTGALFAGFVRSADGSNALKGPDGVPSLEPGAMARLGPNEEIVFTDPPDLSASFDPFVRAMLRRIAAGMNMPYEVLSGDLSAVTFASGRAGLLEWARQIEAIQYNVMVAQFCQPIYRRWLSLAQATGAIAGETAAPRWIAPRIAMLDPRADTLAQIASVRAGFTSRSEIIAQNGLRAEDIDTEIAADNARADRLGLVLDTDPRRVSLQGMAQQQPADAPADSNGGNPE